MCVKEIIGLITGFVGGEDAYGKGAGLMKSAAKEVGGRAGKAITGTVGAFARARGASKQGGFGAAAKSFFIDSIGKSLVGKGNDALKTLTGGAVDIKGTIEKGKTSYYEGMNAAKKAADIKKEGKYGEFKAQDKVGTYMGSTASDTDSRRASKAVGMLSDDMKKVVFDNLVKDGSATKGVIENTLGLKGKKQDEALSELGVMDNFINLFERINKASAGLDRNFIDFIW